MNALVELLGRRKTARRELEQARAAVVALEQVLRDAAAVARAPMSAEDIEAEVTGEFDAPARPAR